MKSPTNPIIPVLDLMIGQVVLATGGNRDAYRPVHSKLTNSSVPRDVARAMFYQTGCNHLYLADIDSFAGADPNWQVYNELLEGGFTLWIDADWLCKNRFQQIADRIKVPDKVKVILSSETMSNLDQFSRLGELIAAGISPIFSLDQKGGSVITQSGELASLSGLELIQQAFDQGVRDLIVLDLESVGTFQGIAENELGIIPLLQEISQELPELRLVSGGGIRSAADAQRLLDSGCQHVLVASAIHDCRFTPDDAANLRPFKKDCRV